MNYLTIYKCSGVDQKNAPVSVWTGGTFEPLNTRAFNGELSRINLRDEQYQLALEAGDYDKASSLSDDIDLHCIVLNALKLAEDEKTPYPLEKSAGVINGMINDNLFECAGYTDKDRSDNFDILYNEYKSRMLNGITDDSDSEFMRFWQEYIVAENSNGLTTEQQQRLNDYLSDPKAFNTMNGVEDVATLDPKQYKSVADYLKGCGPYFLYLFLSDRDKQPKIVQERLRKENEMYEYVKNNVGGMYDDTTIMNYLKLGNYQVYGMSPEKKIADLQAYGQKLKSGKMGEAVTAIITAIVVIISVVLSIVSATIEMIQKCYQMKYQKPDAYDTGVPCDDDYDLQFRYDDETTVPVKKGLSTKTILAIAGGIGALMLLSK